MTSEFSSTADLLRAYFDLLVADLGLFRLIYRNFHQVAPGVYRSSQPAPIQIRQAAGMGIRTIVNLRGPSAKGHYRLEQAACARHGVKLVDLLIYSRDLLSPETLHNARELFEKLDYPVLFHCKSGADRAGFISALYVFVHLGLPLEQAIGQLSLRYGHFRHSDTGVLDRFFETFHSHAQTTGEDFFDWIDGSYDPKAMKQEFRAGLWSRTLVNTILRRE